MVNKSIKLSDIVIKSAHDVDAGLLQEFYRAMFPDYTALPNIWEWLNRSSFHRNHIPLVLEHKTRVVAHAGIIPFTVSLSGETFNAAWFIDFAVLPEFQRLGLGALLTDSWMEFSDLYVTFCNEKSMGVFKKKGWVESFDTFLLYHFILPFDHPRIVRSVPSILRKALNSVFAPFLNTTYRKYASHADTLNVDSLNSDSLKQFRWTVARQTTGVAPVRDTDYTSWRLVSSPNFDSYKIVSIKRMENVKFIIKLCDKCQPAHIDLLCTSNAADYCSVRQLISTLAVWAKEQNYSYIRQYTSSRALASYLRKYLRSLVRHPRFAFYSKNDSLFRQLSQSDWCWELVDSDFEDF